MLRGAIGGMLCPGFTTKQIELSFQTQIIKANKTAGFSQAITSLWNCIRAVKVPVPAHACAPRFQAQIQDVPHSALDPRGGKGQSQSWAFYPGGSNSGGGRGSAKKQWFSGQDQNSNPHLDIASSCFFSFFFYFLKIANFFTARALTIWTAHQTTQFFPKDMPFLGMTLFGKKISLHPSLVKEAEPGHVTYNAASADSPGRTSHISANQQSLISAWTLVGWKTDEPAENNWIQLPSAKRSKKVAFKFQTRIVWFLQPKRLFFCEAKQQIRADVFHTEQILLRPEQANCPGRGWQCNNGNSLEKLKIRWANSQTEVNENASHTVPGVKIEISWIKIQTRDTILTLASSIRMYKRPKPLRSTHCQTFLTKRPIFFFLSLFFDRRHWRKKVTQLWT